RSRTNRAPEGEGLVEVPRTQPVLAMPIHVHVRSAKLVLDGAIRVCAGELAVKRDHQAQAIRAIAARSVFRRRVATIAWRAVPRPAGRGTARPGNPSAARERKRATTHADLRV